MKSVGLSRESNTMDVLAKDQFSGVDEELFKHYVRGLGIRAVLATMVSLMAFAGLWSGTIDGELMPVILLCACEIVANIPYYVFAKRARSAIDLKRYFYGAMIVDVLIITSSLHFLGGIHASFFVFLYAVVIVYAGVVLSYRDCFVMATVCAISYGALLALENMGLFPSLSQKNFAYTAHQQVFIFMGYAIFFYAMAYLSGYLADIIKKTQQTLIETQREVIRLEKERADEVHLHAITDWLTGLYNHRYFHECLRNEIQRAQRYSQPFCLLMGDLDHFKGYNDSHGHPEGDLLLKKAAGIITTTIRQSDTAARYGGDEFVVVLPYADRSNGVRIAEEVRKAVKQGLNPPGEKQTSIVTISFGVSSYPVDGVHLDELVKKADQSLYQAKKEGRDRICVPPSPSQGLSQTPFTVL